MKQTLGIFLVFLWSLTAMAQESLVSGKVTDGSDGSPLPGVTVSIKGTTNGTVTNIDGFYEIKANTGEVLVFSFIGMKSVETTITGTQQNATMASETTDLDDVVVVGYGVQKKVLVTGANLNVKGEDVAKLAPNSPMESLKGTSPGVKVQSSSGAPGAETKVVIRGIGTTGDSKPMYIVDGVSVGNIDHLNASDIASINVLKDAASSAIYGSRAANGVILVTTKKGTKGSAPTVTYDGYYGVQNIAKKPEMLNAQEYMTIIDEAYVNDGLAGLDWSTEIPDNALYQSYINGSNKGTNWSDEILTENAVQQNHSIGVNGGSEDITYSLGTSYFEQEGIIGGDIIGAGYDRFSLRQNTDFVLFKNDRFDVVKIGTSATYTQSHNKQVASGNMYYNDYRNALTQQPLMPVYDTNSTDPNGYSRAWTYSKEMPNPIAAMYYQRNFTESVDKKIIGNAYIEIQPIKDLRVKTQYGVDAYFGNNRSYTPTYDLGGTSPVVSEDNVSQSMYSGNNSTWTTTASYDFKVSDVHSFNVVVGNELYQNQSNLNINGNKSNSKFGDWQHAYLDNVDKQEELAWINVGGFDTAAQGGAILSYFGRFNYDYDSRYMFSATLRADGSSKFADGNKWGYFPSVSAGWNFTEESFMEDYRDIMDYGKLRASWGQVGNQSVDPFRYIANMSFDNVYYNYGGDKQAYETGAYPSFVPTPDITWETSEQLDLGFDARFLASRLSLTFDWYKKSTKDWLVTPPSAGTLGAPKTSMNGGDVVNKGIELSLGWTDEIGDFSYGIMGSMSYNQNEVTRVESADGIFHGSANVLAQGTSETYRAEVGMPIGYFWGYKTAGILQNDAEAAAYRAQFANDKAMSAFKPGDVRFVDQNGDGLIDDKDKVEIGNPNPDVIVGLQLDFGYKNVYLSATFNGQFGGQNMRCYRSFTDRPKQNYTTEVLDRWHGEGTSNKYPRVTMSANESTRYMSDLYVENSDFVRLNNLTLGYKFTKLARKTSFLKDAKLYVQGQNLLTITNYGGLNPEIGYAPESWASGVDLGLYPATRTIMAGLNLTF